MSDRQEQDGLHPAVGSDEPSFRALVEALPDAILIHVNDEIVFVNPFCVRLLAAETAERLLGKEISEFINPAYLPVIRQRIQECYVTGKSTTPLDAVLIACDGSPVEIEAVAAPILWKGLPAIEVVLRDIRARKLAEASEQAWQKRLELAQMGGLRIGLWDWDVVSNTVEWSEESYRQFGFTRDDFSGRVEDAVPRIHPEDRPQVEEAVRKVKEGNKEYSAQYRLVQPDGTVHWIDAHGVIVGDRHSHMVGVGVDITELKNSEQSLKNSEEQYRLLLNSTAEAIYGIDLEGSCTFCNPACLRHLGYQAAADLLGRNMHDVMHHTRPDGTVYPVEECRIFLAFRAGRPGHVADEVLWRKDGTSFPAEYWSYPILKADKIVGAVVTFLDISDRKRSEKALQESEQRYRQLFSNATYGIYVSRPDGALLEANPAMVAMLGYNAKEELLALNLNHDIYESPAARAAILEKYGPGGRVDGAEANWKRKDGSIIRVRISGGAARSPDGSISHYEVLVEDITERQILEEQFRQAQKMEAVGRLAGGVAHDFNNLLMIIITYSQMLGERVKDDEPLRRMADHVLSAGRKAASLTQQLLAFSRRQVLLPTVLDLNTVLADLGKMLPRLIGEDIDLQMVPGDALGKIKADAAQLQQVILNLAVNARDAMPNGGRLIIETANTELHESRTPLGRVIVPGPYVTLTVSDTGTGMDEATQLRIFEPFFTTKGVDKGTGLGLSIVFGVIKQSGGYIFVDSRLGQGTTFRLCLPKVDHAPAPQIAAPEPIARGNETILLVEDAEGVRVAVGDFLEDIGYQVLKASDPADALTLLRQQNDPVHMLLTDVVMPGMNGRELAQQVKANNPEMKVLYMSGYTDRGSAHNGPMDFGADFLQKPFSLGKLARKMRELLDCQASAR